MIWFTAFSLPELRHHPWRNAAAVVAVLLGVALAFSVHLINASALAEFSGAVRSVDGQPDLELRARSGGFDEKLYARVAALGAVRMASPVLELDSVATTAGGTRVPIRLVGVDALTLAPLAPSLMPRPRAGADRFALFAPDTVFLNAAAARLAARDKLTVQDGLAQRTLVVAGDVAAGGAATAVMDLGALQSRFGRAGQLTRIDLRLAPGTDRAALMRELALPADVVAAEPGDAAARIGNLSRAYRVNLTVLALVALFTGAFLVFSVLSLGVARRTPQFALLGVLGLTARQRLALVLGESCALGAVGSVLGIAAGTALAATALALLGGDLGGGYFPGASPTLHWSTPAALGYGALGIAAAAVGGWLPARQAATLPLAASLKGFGSTAAGGTGSQRFGWALVVLAGVFAAAPPIAGIALGAYLSVALLLVGGVLVLPGAIALLYDRLAPLVAGRLLPQLAVERARRVRESAAVAVSGVVASLALSVALTVMVASFRDSVTRWLDVVLPADLYVRTAAAGTANSDTAYLDEAFIQRAARVPGIERVATQRVRSIALDPTRPTVAVIARPIADPARDLPLVGDAIAPPPGQIAIYVSEAMVDLYGAAPGRVFEPFSKSFPQGAQEIRTSDAIFFVAGVWRDYARQSGSVMIAQEDWRRLTGDTRTNDLLLWLSPGADAARVQSALREAAGGGNALEFASAREIRRTSLRIFDRSFVVTYWLQGVAIAIGLFGVAASFSAQVLARRKEFGLLAHLGLTRRQILAVVAGEGAAWTVIGSLAGLVLGLAVAVVLIHVVNPQSFHWTMDLLVPWARIGLLCAAVVAAGTLTAWIAGRAAAGRDAVLAVKEDW